MSPVPIIGEETAAEHIDKLTQQVIELLEEVPLGSEELIGIIELSMLDTISSLAGYVHEMQTQIMRALGGIPTPGEPTTEDFIGRYVEDYTLLRMARTQSLLAARLTDKHAVEREVAVHAALDAEGNDGG